LIVWFCIYKNTKLGIVRNDSIIFFENLPFINQERNLKKGTRLDF